ncbi:MAG: DUF3422 family protein [Hyphomonas sp.]|nr:DUF3422 family protein [Hyphomonas sp.]
MTCERSAFPAKASPIHFDKSDGEEITPSAQQHHHRPFVFHEAQSRAIDGFFASICETFQIAEAQTRFNASLHAKAIIGDVQLVVVVDRFRDHLAIQLTADLNASADAAPDQNAESEQPLSFEFDAPDLSAKALRDAMDEFVADGGKHKNARKLIYETFWDEVALALCLTASEQAQSKLFSIVDYRGVIFSEDTFGITLDELRMEKLESLAVEELDRINEDLPFRAMKNALNEQDVVSNSEILCCSVYHGTLLYMSNLGSEIFSTGQTSWDDTFTTFAAVCKPVNRWQVGRIIYRVNQAGQYRIMSLKDFAEFNDIGKKLKNLLQKMEGIRGISGSQEQMEERLSNLSKMRVEIDEIGIGGLQEVKYMIKRSQDLSTRFSQIISTLELSRIPGWQPYSDFVTRRVTPVYNQIETVRERLATVESAYHNILEELDNELQRHNEEALVSIQQELLGSQSFQHKIESIALAYYGGTIIFYIISTACYQLGGSAIFDKIEKPVKFWSFSGTTLFALLYYRYQEWAHHEKKHHAEEVRKQMWKGVPKSSREKSPSLTVSKWLRGAPARFARKFRRSGTINPSSH